MLLLLDLDAVAAGADVDVVSVLWASDAVGDGGSEVGSVVGGSEVGSLVGGSEVGSASR